MGIAGVYRRWTAPDGKKLFTMTMLTVNAADHPVMKRFHKPQEEKRMVVVLDPSEYGPWLTCSVDEARRYFTLWRGPLVTTPREMDPPPPRPGETPDLF